MALLLSNKPKLDPKKPNKSHTPNDIYKDQSFEPARPPPPPPPQQPQKKKLPTTQIPRKILRPSFFLYVSLFPD